jgi:hypothetical protein
MLYVLMRIGVVEAVGVRAAIASSGVGEDCEALEAETTAAHPAHHFVAFHVLGRLLKNDQTVFSKMDLVEKKALGELLGTTWGDNLGDNPGDTTRDTLVGHYGGKPAPPQGTSTGDPKGENKGWSGELFGGLPQRTFGI